MLRKKDIDRRQFIGGTTAAVASTSALSYLAASPASPQNASNNPADQAKIDVKRADAKPIRVGLIRCDTHGMYYAALMVEHYPLLLMRPPGPGSARRSRG